MSQWLDFWVATRAAFSAIIDSLPAEQQAKVLDQLQSWARVLTDKGELQAAYFCRDLSGEEFPQPQPKPDLKIVD
jgi:hypothetical protein